MNQKLAFLASPSPTAQQALAELTQRYGQNTPEAADCIITLGGDGFMLHTLHRYHHLNKPVYGMNRGSIGFLNNSYNADRLLERLKKARATLLYSLRMQAQTLEGKSITAHAINEVSLLRQTHQAAKIRVSIDDVTRLEELVCDGILVATSAGSTAYNLSAHGPIIPIGANLLALTPISAFRPRRWRGALLPDTAKVIFDILDADQRRVSAMADDQDVHDVTHVEVDKDPNISYTLLFDPDHNLEERILNEQFYSS
jgi:NAD+ kinase